MFSASEIILGNVVPPLIALVVLLVAAQPWRRDDTRRGAWGGPIAIALTALVAIGTVLGIHPAVSPKQVDQWLYPLIIGSTALGLFQALVRPKWWIVAALVLFSSATVAFTMVPNAVQQAWDTTHLLIWLCRNSIAMTLWWILLEAFAQKLPSRWVAGIFGFLTGGTGLVLMMTLSISSGRYLAAIASAVGMALLITLIVPKLDLSGGTSLVLVTILGAFLCTGYVRAPDELPLTPAMMILLFVAPGTAWITMRFAPDKPAVRGTAALVALIVPIAIAVALATPKFLKSIDESSSDAYGAYK